MVKLTEGQTFEWTKGATWWNAPGRGAKVAALIPGRRIAHWTSENLFVDWTKQQVEKWEESHSPLRLEDVYRKNAETEPTDAELTADFPTHIAPFARVRFGSPGKVNAADALISDRPFCQSKLLALKHDSKNPYHATTRCMFTRLP